MSGPQSVSFTVRRPTPISRAASSGPESDSSSFKVPSLPRHLLQSAESPSSGSPLARSEANSPYTNGYNSSDEDDTTQDELVTGFDKFGVQRLHEDRKKKKEEPLVIPALKNKDWRELARKRRSAQQYIPASAKVYTGADGPTGGTKDVIGAGRVLSGLQLGNKLEVEANESTVTKEEMANDVKMEETDLSEDEVALRAVLAEASGLTSNAPIIDAIPTPVSEGDAYKQDVDELPEVASLEDYARVPVEQFGAAMLRGMGWKEGTAASKNGKGLAKPYLPMARPALLGIGAKEMEAFDDGSKKKGSSRPEKRYIPVIKRERETSSSGRGRSRSPRRNSPSVDGNREYHDRRRDDYDHRHDRDRVREREREVEYKDKDKDRERATDKHRERDRNRHDRDRSVRNGHQRKEDR